MRNTVPNQKVLTIHKEVTDKEHKYSMHNLEALARGAKDLQKPASYKLYIYLSKNQNGYETALSSADFCEWAGCGMTAYNSAVQELKDKGYLVAKTGATTRYTFYDMPQEESDFELVETIEEEIKISSPVITPRQQRPVENGFIF